MYLHPSVMIEPLFNQWLADVNLIPPVNAALTTANSHLKMLKSFVATPKMHAEAAKNPKLLGGPFVDVEISRAPEIQALVERTERDLGELLKLADAVKALDALVIADKDGLGLEKVYPKVPDALRGYVELRYDMYHRASPRYLEALLYQSPFYKPSAQGFLLSRTNADTRPLGFSTPRLPVAGQVLLSLPFADPRVDRLMRARFEDVAVDALAAELGVSKEQEAAFAALFTAEAPKRASRPEAGVRIRYFGHSCLLAETKDVAVLVDPTFGLQPGSGVERFSYADLPERIDQVLITHAHGDHFSLEALLAIRHRVGTVLVPRSGGGTLVDPSLELLLRTLGFKDVRSVEHPDRVELAGGGAIEVFPFLGEHGDLDIRAKASFVVALGGKRIFAVGDAAGVEPKLYDLLKPSLGELDVMFLAMESHGAPLSWGYGPLFTTPIGRAMDFSRRQTAASLPQVMDLIGRLKPKRYVGYAMGWEAWLRHVVAVGDAEVESKRKDTVKVVDQAKALGVPAEMAYGRLEIQL